MRPVSVIIIANGDCGYKVMVTIFAAKWLLNRKYIMRPALQL